MAGTEKGLVGVLPEFSTCFGAPFLPRHPSVYGNLLRELISAHGVDCWLVNTGWTGGIYGVGRRMPIKVTRTLLSAALDGSLKSAKFRTDPYFGFAVPTQLAGVEPHLLYPQKTWQDKLEFDNTARKLVGMFQKNFVQFENHVEADVRAAAPEVRTPPPATITGRVASCRIFNAARTLASSASGRNGGTRANCGSTSGSMSASSASIWPSLPRNCRCTGPGQPVTAARKAWRTMSGKRATSSMVALNLVTGSNAGMSSISW